MCRIGLRLSHYPFLEERTEPGIAEAECVEGYRQIAFFQYIFFETFLIGIQLGVQHLELSISQLLDKHRLVRGERRRQDLQRTTDAGHWPVGNLKSYQRYNRRAQNLPQ